MFVWHMRTNIAKNNVTSTSTTFKKHLFTKYVYNTGEIQCDKKQLSTHKNPNYPRRWVVINKTENLN